MLNKDNIFSYEGVLCLAPQIMTGQLITRTTLLKIKSMPKDTLINQYATYTKLNAKSYKAKCSVQIAWVEGK